jgi:hypothetical protein
MWVHDLNGTLLILGTWIFCGVGGGLVSSFVDGEHRRVRNVLWLLALGYPIAVTQAVRGWAIAVLLAAGLAVSALAFMWYRTRKQIKR